MQIRRPTTTTTRPTLLCSATAMAVLLQLLAPPAAAWMPDVRPDLHSKEDKILARFVGNQTDFFKVLEHNDANILIGARDTMYNISLIGLREVNRLRWYSTDADRELCALKGKTEVDCHNYVRVFARLQAEDQLLVCGTNSYKPRCRHYARAGGPGSATAAANANAGSGTGAYDEVVRDVEAQGLCPYSPAHNSTYAYADGHLYSATVADFSGSDPLIYRENLRTEQYDLKQLNQPDFVGAIERKDYVLFFFRELSMEYMNFGKTIYSRVARVCKNDRGGPYTLSKSWTSFLKARLNCSVPGEFPFYFDEIQAISPIVDSPDSEPVIYAVFTTSANAIPGSAVCAFTVSDIMDAFDEGPFQSQRDTHSHWLPMQEEQVPEPRPGKCVDDSRTMSSIAVNFAKMHPLMGNAVSAVYGRPLLTKVNLHHRLTAIATDARIAALNGEHYDVIYVGTDDGKVTKFFNIPRPSRQRQENTNNSNTTTTATPERLRTVFISEYQVLPLGVPVRELVVSSATNTLLAVSDGQLVTVPLHRCAYIVDCIGCLWLQDPSCAWDIQNHECKSLHDSNTNKFGTKAYLQSLNTTKKAAASLCPSKAGRGSGAASAAAAAAAQTPALPPPEVIVPVNSVSIDLQSVAGGGGGSSMPGNEDNLQVLSKKLVYSNVAANGGDASALLPTGGVVTTPNMVTDGIDLALEGLDPDDLLQSGYSDDNIITLHNSLNDPLIAPAHTAQTNLQLAGKSFFFFASVALAVVFIVGMGVGLFVSKHKCRAAAMHANHRNQFNSNGQFGLKHGKDVNLLMNPNHYCSTSVANGQQKKANLDLEKDRSHECKNSTENLEKELPCKTSTLTKVKRTYI